MKVAQFSRLMLLSGNLGNKERIYFKGSISAVTLYMVVGKGNERFMNKNSCLLQDWHILLRDHPCQLSIWEWDKTLFPKWKFVDQQSNNSP
ncbi:hypothetical protein FRX31_016482 [Thalictrum thalictroides]|uniref:Uncharacterized protein n=1 Tax=Thalictrum thalictroides TaxID=46969 RepID=A0A7J6WAF4_THATH|nr:hypothetical protein FRX31_016482 [Thalictrum thalictroides]